MESILQYILHNKKKGMSVLAIICMFIIMSLCIFLIRKNDIVQVVDTITIEAGQDLHLTASDFFDVNEENSKKIVFNTENVDGNTVGTYEAEARFGKQAFKIRINVEDTKAPMITFAKRYMFTSNIENTDNIMVMVENIYEASEFTMRLIRFEKKENLRVLDEDGLKQLTDDMDAFCDADKLEKFGTEEIPKEEGIYQAVLEAADIYGNTVYEEVVLILDKTGAYIEEVPDKVVGVDRESLNNEPKINPADYVIHDNVDGNIAAEFVNLELELRDEEQHEWLVHVCYIDRAGNESRADFLILVKEKEKIERNIESAKNDTDVKASEENRNSENTIENAEESSEKKEPDNSKNQNENEWIPTDDENDISPWEQKVIDAGYGNVVDFGDSSYGVLTHNDGYADGKRGGEILREYLAERGLEPQNVSGGIIDEQKDWRWYIADNIREINNSGNDW